MPLVDLVMPKMGESIMEATILKWLKQPGDAVKQDETVLEIATDKVDTEVPSVAAGTLEEILFQVNDVVPIGVRHRSHPDGNNRRQTPSPGDNTLAPAGAEGAGPKQPSPTVNQSAHSQSRTTHTQAISQQPPKTAPRALPQTAPVSIPPLSSTSPPAKAFR
jgi:2-oxoglutarate dehydrogenase E2 component (dihydrolipoamide succinyltransferase)